MQDTDKNTINGYYYLCLPEFTYSICKEIETKTNLPVVEVISEAIKEYATKYGVKHDPGNR